MQIHCHKLFFVLCNVLKFSDKVWRGSVIYVQQILLEDHHALGFKCPYIGPLVMTPSFTVSFELPFYTITKMLRHNDLGAKELSDLLTFFPPSQSLMVYESSFFFNFTKKILDIFLELVAVCSSCTLVASV